MDKLYILTGLALLAYGKSVPPQMCFQPFNWEDCGRPPVHVLYYYKSGSRCEVGVWRGCLPNLNMFKDEYECVNTCVFVERAQPQDFHMLTSANMLGSKIGEGGNDTYYDSEPMSPTDEPEPSTTNVDGVTNDYEPINSVEVDHSTLLLKKNQKT